MFREMRRIGQQITNEECLEILSKANTGILGVIGDNGYPYTVPVNFVFKQGKDGSPGTISFHGAKEGYKIDCIKKDPKVSFTVVDRDEVMPKERTTKYCSVIAFGKARLLESEEDLRDAANSLGTKYSSGYEDLYLAETEDVLRQQCMSCVEIKIEHITGKIGMELLHERQREKDNHSINA